MDNYPTLGLIRNFLVPVRKSVALIMQQHVSAGMRWVTGSPCPLFIMSLSKNRPIQTYQVCLERPGYEHKDGGGDGEASVNQDLGEQQTTGQVWYSERRREDCPRQNTM